MSKVLIADDHAVFRAGLRQFLGEVPGVSEIGEAVSGNDTLDRLRENEWDLLVLDLNMPDRGGIDILRHVRAGHAGTRILVLSGYPERQYAMNVLRAGANGYIAHVMPEIRYDRAALGKRESREQFTAEIMRAFEPAIRQYLTQWYHFVPIWPESASPS